MPPMAAELAEASGARAERRSGMVVGACPDGAEPWRAAKGGLNRGASHQSVACRCRQL